jgi:hypothetical protein
MLIERQRDDRMSTATMRFLFAIIVAFSTQTLSQAFVSLNPRSVIRHRQGLGKHDVVVALQLSASADSSIIPETHGLPPHTFAGMVEHAMVEKFGEDPARRVIQSWRLLEMGYEHQEFLGHGDPQTSDTHQHAHSYVPGLKAQPFYDIENHGWCRKLANKYKDIQREFKQVTSDMENLQRQGNNVWASALTEDASSYGAGWKTLVLMDRGIWDPTNTNLFPKTAKAVRDSGAPVTEVFFASMQPHSDIQPHSDFTNFVVTCHLGLDIPESGNNKCRLTIGDETRQWINGQVMLFDTSIRHRAINEADETRYILMLRVWHPDLTPVECQALQFIYDSLALPGLVSTDATERSEAERQLNAFKQFPLVKTGSVGFGGVPGTSKKKKIK